MDLNKLLIIDGRHLFWRTCDAFNDLVTDINGEETPIGGVYGFLLTLSRIHSRYPYKLAICWEGKNNFRYKLYPDYKDKGEIDEDKKLLIQEMKEQEIRLKALLRIIGIKQYKSIDCEADDTMGALANKFANKNRGNMAFIYTGDSDLRQLVNDEVKVISPGRRSSEVIYDREVVFLKHGVAPEHIADLKALSGDHSDNIPGVKGIGPKTAVKLIRRYGSLEDILNNMDSENWPVPDRFRDMLKNSIEDVKLFKKLTTIKSDVKLSRIKERNDWDKVKKIFRLYKFHSLLVPQEFRKFVKMVEK